MTTHNVQDITHFSTPLCHSIVARRLYYKSELTLPLFGTTLGVRPVNNA